MTTRITPHTTQKDNVYSGLPSRHLRLIPSMGTTWGPLLIAWEKYLRASGVPETTIGQRTYHVGRLARELGKTPDKITLQHLVDWLAEHDWKPNTRRSYRGSLRAFYAWAIHMGHVKASPAHLLPPVKVPRGRPKPTPEPVFRDLLGIRDERVLLAIRLAGQCGLRRGELATAKREHVEPDLAGWCLRVSGKGGVVRLVPLPDDLAAEILRRPAGWLFPSTQGGHLTPHHLGKVISRNLPDGLTTHSLRHRCATVAYAATRDLRAVQELLGHAKPETTAIYTAVPDGAVRAAVAASAA